MTKRNSLYRYNLSSLEIQNSLTSEKKHFNSKHSRKTIPYGTAVECDKGLLGNTHTNL